MRTSSALDPDLAAKSILQATSDSPPTSCELLALMPALQRAAPRAVAEAQAPLPAQVQRYLEQTDAAAAARAKDRAARALWLTTPGQKTSFLGNAHRQVPTNPFSPDFSATPAYSKVRYLSLPNGEVFRRGPLVGRGSYSKIYNVLNGQNEPFVARLLHLDPVRHPGRDPMSVTPLWALTHEYTAMQAVNSPLLPVQFFHLQAGNNDANATKLVWIQRRYDADLEQLHRTPHVPIPLPALRHLARNLAQQLNQLHAAGYVHADLKPANVLYRQGGQLVLADFGLATPLDSTDHFSGTGTIGYLAPEGYKYGHGMANEVDKRDVFSLGVLLTELTFPHLLREHPLTNLLKLQRDAGVEDAHASNAWRRANTTDGFAASRVVDRLEVLRRKPVLNFEDEAFLRAHAQEAQGLTKLRAAWTQLDPHLGAMVMDNMLSVHSWQRASAQMVASALHAGPNQLGYEAQEARRFFDQTLGAFVHKKGQAQGQLSFDELRLVPRRP